MLGSDKERICQLLIRIALSDRTQASKAVLLSVLALASYHRGNDLAFAARMKHAALRTLLEATGQTMDAFAGIEHIAAGAVLCIIEVTNQINFDSQLKNLLV